MTSRTRMSTLLVLSLMMLPISQALAGKEREGTGDGQSGRPGNPGILPPNSMPGGKSYGDWGAAWWTWDYSLPYSTNPIFDPSGSFNQLNQSGPVWFLAGNTGGTSVRSLTVPWGKMIFFPLMNAVNDYPCPDTTFHPAAGQTLEDFLTNGVKAIFDPVPSLGTLTLTIDGEPQQNLFAYRGTSHLFTFTGDPSMTAFDPCITGSPQQGVADGFWIMLAPLDQGQHTLRFTASVPSYGFALDVTYHLTVGRGAGTERVTDAKQTSWGRLKVIYR